MADEIEVLGCVARRTVDDGAAAHTPLGSVVIVRTVPGNVGKGWSALWVPRGAKSMVITLTEYEPNPADAAREATRRLRAIQRTCARAEVSR